MTAVLTEASIGYDATKTGGDSGKSHAVGAELMRVRGDCCPLRHTRRERLNFIRTEFLFQSSGPRVRVIMLAQRVAADPTILDGSFHNRTRL